MKVFQKNACHVIVMYAFHGHNLTTFYQPLEGVGQKLLIIGFIQFSTMTRESIT